MTELEWLEAAQAVWSNGLSVLAIYLTVLSGYLIIAYAVGKDIKPGQLRIINFLYVGVSIFLIAAFTSYAIHAGELDQIAFDMTIKRRTQPTGYFAYGVSAFLTLCFAASLKFMADIRNEDE